MNRLKIWWRGPHNIIWISFLVLFISAYIAGVVWLFLEREQFLLNQGQQSLSSSMTVATSGIFDSSNLSFIYEKIFPPQAFILLMLASFLIVCFVVYFVLKSRLHAFASYGEQRARMLLITFHELGSPLGLVRYTIDNLNELKPSITDFAVAESYNRIIITLTEAVNRFDKILQVLHKANKIQTGKLEYKAKSNDLVATIYSSIDKLKFNLDKKGQHVLVNVLPPFLCRFDPEEIGAVITELITNASCYSPLKSSITINVISRFRKVEVTIQDQGTGIDSSDLKHLFEEFSRGKKSIQYSPDGYGLGLYICKGIINNAGGDIWVNSKPGQGTTIHFTLPR